MRSPRTATKSSPRSPQLEKAPAQQRRPNAAKNKFKKKKPFLPLQLSSKEQPIKGQKFKCLSVLAPYKWVVVRWKQPCLQKHFAETGDHVPPLELGNI